MSIRIRPNWDQSYHLILLDVISDAYTTTINYVWDNDSLYGMDIIIYGTLIANNDSFE